MEGIDLVTDYSIFEEPPSSQTLSDAWSDIICFTCTTSCSGSSQLFLHYNPSTKIAQLTLYIFCI